MTITKQSGPKLIVEVHTDAGFLNFYNWYTQDGRKRKKFVRTSHRGDGLERHYDHNTTPGLELIAKGMQALANSMDRMAHDYRRAALSKPIADYHIISAVIKVYKKRLYAKLLNCPPNELNGGLVKAVSTAPENHHWERSETPILVGNWPSSSLRKREAELAGGRR
jgi:hypothetical protein